MNTRLRASIATGVVVFVGIAAILAALTLRGETSDASGARITDEQLEAQADNGQREPVPEMVDSPEPVVTPGGPRSVQLKELADGAVPIDARLIYAADHDSVDLAETFEGETVAYELANGTVLTIRRQFFPEDRSIPAEAILLGKPGRVETWSGGVEAVIVEHPEHPQVVMITGTSLFNVNAQAGPVWFGDGVLPPSGFYNGKLVRDISVDVVETVARQLIALHLDG